MYQDSGEACDGCGNRLPKDKRVAELGIKIWFSNDHKRRGYNRYTFQKKSI